MERFEPALFDLAILKGVELPVISIGRKYGGDEYTLRFAELRGFSLQINTNLVVVFTNWLNVQSLLSSS